MPIIIGGASLGGGAGSLGTSLTAFRQYTAKELGPFQTTVAAATSSSTAWIDLAWPINSTLPQDSMFVDQFLYRPGQTGTNDATRVVKLYTPGGGVLSPDLPYLVAPTLAELGELHGRVDPTVLTAALNECLKELMIVAELVINP